MNLIRLAAAVCLACAPLSHAADFPVKPITLIVAYAPGGLGDALARTIAERLTASLKQPVLVENKPGATGAIATKFRSEEHTSELQSR